MTRLFAYSSLLVLATTGCGGSGFGLLDPGAGDDPGSGSGTLRVDADVEASPIGANATDPTQFTTDFRVECSKDGAAVNTGQVTLLSRGGEVALTWDGSSWRGVQAGYFEVYVLNVISGTDQVEDVRVDGPDAHYFTTPIAGAVVDATVPLAIEWERDDIAQSATLKTKEIDSLSIADLGSYELPAGSLKSKPDASEDEEIQVTRSARITPAGATADSELRVRIENRVEVLVQATGL